MVCLDRKRERDTYSKGLCASCYDRKNRKRGKCITCGEKTCRQTVQQCKSCSNAEQFRRIDYHHSFETRQKIRENTPIRIGKQHPCWTGGKNKFWKDRAKERDNYTCQKCGMSDRDIMVVDHIIPRSVRPDLDYELNNLMTLCPNCHARKTIYEKKNNVYKLGFQLP